MMNEYMINKICNDVFQCIAGLPYENGLTMLSANMLRVLILGVKNGAWTKEEAVIIVKRFSDGIDGLLDKAFEVNQ